MMIEKDNLYRDRDLLDLARDEECLMRVPGVCKIDRVTTVSAHSNQAKHGKGGAIKAHDTYSVWACARCHAWLDQGHSATQEQKIAAWAAGFRRQVIAWRAIAENIAAKPWRVSAAQRAIEWLKTRKEIA